MSAAGELFVLKRTITIKNGRRVSCERKIYGVLDADGTFHLRAYCEKRLSVLLDLDEQLKNGKTAA